MEKRQSCETEPSTHGCDVTSKFIASELCGMVGHPVGVQELLGSAWETPVVHWCQNLKRKNDLYVSREEEVSKPTHVQRSSKWTPKTLKLVFKIDQKFN